MNCGCGHPDMSHDPDTRECGMAWVKYEGTPTAYPVSCGCLALHTQTVSRLVTITLTRAVEAERERRALSGS